MNPDFHDIIKREVEKIRNQALVVFLLIVFLLFLPLFAYKHKEISALFSSPKPEKAVVETTDEQPAKDPSLWTAPDMASLSDGAQKKELEYGKELIAHTATYFGPKGSVLQISNGLNCQNCHLDAGTKPWGNNYGSVASTYPKLRARSGSMENIPKRVNDCFERSLNGKPIDPLGAEMKAIVAYINFLGKDVEKGKKANGSGFKNLAFLERAADPQKGKLVYEAKCQSCHQADGSGTLNEDGKEYAFPPLWGKNSYNDAAGLYRISNFAKYVKYNMPLGVTYDSPQLTDEEAWDVAAYVNTQARPHKRFAKDWPDISKKPIDHPFGPYADQFTEKEHKLGPFKPIENAKKQRETNQPKSS